jgi:hypothetical protein
MKFNLLYLLILLFSCNNNHPVVHHDESIFLAKNEKGNKLYSNNCIDSCNTIGKEELSKYYSITGKLFAAEEIKYKKVKRYYTDYAGPEFDKSWKAGMYIFTEYLNNSTVGKGDLKFAFRTLYFDDSIKFKKSTDSILFDNYKIRLEDQERKNLITYLIY